MGAGGRQSGAGLGDVRRADPIRPHCRYARECPAPHVAGGLARPHGAGRRLGRFRALHHRLQHACGAPCRPSSAPPVSGGADDVLRTRAAIAAELSHRLAFRAPREGDAHRHEYAVGALALLLPRTLRQFRLAHRPAAADAFHQLALWTVADPPVRRVWRGDRTGRAQERNAAKHGRALLYGRSRAYDRYAGKYRSGAELHPD